jgi:hypothetical protein
VELVNRLALILRPRRRFVEWAHTLETEGPKLDLDSARARVSVYLVHADPLDSEQDLSGIIDEYAVEIFETELIRWCADEDLWPLNRTPHVFRDWFDVSTADTVFDCDDDLDMIDPLDDDLEPGDIDPETGNVVVDNEVFRQCMWCGSPVDEDEPVKSVNLRAAPGAKPPPPGVAEISLGARTVRIAIPAPHSEAAQEGFSGMILVCSDQCAEEVRRTLKQSQSDWNS